MEKSTAIQLAAVSLMSENEGLKENNIRTYGKSWNKAHSKLKMKCKGTLSKSSLELNSLRSTVASLRDELEILEIAKQDAVQQAMASQHHELNHFKTMVRTLRDEIDQKGSIHQENLQKKSNRKPWNLNSCRKP